MPASRPAFPSEPNLRRLGVGGSGGGGGGDRLFRAQLVIALVLGFTILAVVLYLLRRPNGKEHAVADAGAASASASAVPSGVVRTKLDEPATKKDTERVSLAPVQRVRCSASPMSRGNEGNLCDSLPVFEEALAKAIRENADCAPKANKAGTLNYVLTLDFERRAVNVFAGRSGDWKGPQAKRAAQCVLRALPAPQWEAVPHQYRYYMIGILASYPAPEANEPFPKFQ